ncbi:MAG: CoA-acylating methylmalonate-semialdehyde dehydrogenase [Bifidobacteriaceae bacterium]|jgi:malonate-semialdehyde dehydrogenase (acetylating)/methylmalonate-semialdehyde dehydrogenase|nr:CoA-acylating methylmalonate-semialdehyde dehydrogenase [Bifidobacteriaceae bacterium]
MVYRVSHYIDGEIGAGGYGTYPICNPATGERIGVVELGDEKAVDTAVASSRRAFEAWSRVSLGRRTDVLFAFRELLKAHAGELGEIVTREHGKILSDALGEVSRGLEVVEFACGIPELLKGEFTAQAATGIDVFSFREPLGVCAGITPFNFPVMCPLWMAPVAIACGNTFVLKPSELDPSASVFIAQLWTAAGLPEGVFNVVQGEGRAATALVNHVDVASVSFVGSTRVGKEVHRGGTAHGKRVQAMCGAKNHGVVLADADLDFAAASVVAAAFGAAGERCMALPVVVAVEEVADRLLDCLVAKAREIKVGDGMSSDVDMGPVISKAHRDRIEQTIAEARAAGARVVLDGRGFRPSNRPEGFFTGPTIIDRVTAEMRVYHEEVFGPVLVVLRARELDDAIGIIKSNRYGNGAAIFTSSGEAARRFARSVPVGMIGVNVPIPVPVAYHSFGGWQDSFAGESHIYGPEGVRFFTQAKVVTQRWPQPTAATAAFHFQATSSIGA